MKHHEKKLFMATSAYDAFLHRLSGIATDVATLLAGPLPASQFVLDRYSSKTFQGIFSDTIAAASSTAGLNQVSSGGVFPNTGLSEHPL
jgi:hypothetical protein